jgi:HAE1 family hydrophobic/amphiphilic exporter-1
MSIYKSSINSPVTTILVFIAVMLMGVFAYVKLPIDQFPEMEPPYVAVMTTYAGANASEIETNVTKYMENSLNSIDGLKEMNSTSKDNLSLVALELEWGEDLDEVVNDIRSYVDMTKDNLPSGCSNPLIIKFNTSSMPVIQFAVQAKESYAGLEKILNDEVIPELSRISGVGNVTLSGEPDRYIYVDIDQKQLDAYSIALESVGNAIASNNINMSSGSIKMDKEQYSLQVRSEFFESSEIANLVVSTTPDGKQIYVKDIAVVRDTIKDLSLDEKMNGEEAVRLMVSKQTGANTVEICKGVKSKIEDLKKSLPADVNFVEIYDSSTDIKNAINSLTESVLYAVIFVVLVVLFFLGKWRASLIIGLTIPISLLVSFLYLLFIDSSLNIISMCSLSIAVGMVVDDAIVVLENIMTHIQRGESPREASIYATNEVWISVIATTLVIVAVFVPLTMLTGMAGVLFKELGWIVTIVCCTSTLAAITLVPMLSSKLLKAPAATVDESGKLIIEKNDKNKFSYENTVVKALDKLDLVYGKLLRWCLNNKVATIAILLIFFGISLVPMLTGKIGTDFMAVSDNGRLNIKIELLQGTRVEETAKFARHLEKRFFELVKETQKISTTCGMNDAAGMSALFSNTKYNTIEMRYNAGKKDTRERDIWTIAEILRKEISSYPEVADYNVAISSGGGMGGESKVEVEIYGYDFNTTNKYAADVKATIESMIPTARNVDISREDDRPELQVIVDKEKAARNGLTSLMVSQYVRNRVNGMSAGFLKEDGSEYDILVRLKEENRSSISDIENLTIPTQMGLVKLNEISKIEEYWGPPEITRRSRQRFLSVSVTPYETSLGELAADIEKVLDTIEKPDGVSVVIGGDYEEQQESFADMTLLMIIIVILVYVVMASQFESLSKPFLIMMSVPFAFSGVFIALFVTNTNLDMIGVLGMIMLVGIVVKNGIVLVDYINLLRDRGHELNEAIALSGESRLRPVLMTACTTILGMIPMALSTADGSEMWVPMGIVVIGGLLVSTVLTLVVVPVLYAVMSRHGERDNEAEIRKQFIFMDIDEKKVEKKK